MEVSTDDILRAARLMIKRYKEDAVIEASMRSDSALELGDLANARLWQLVAKAIYALERKAHEAIN